MNIILLGKLARFVYKNIKRDPKIY
uniref:Uncharacterized protein n=1 Tax=Physcomitrium patens TaxID=3218 RepID=A0A2K1IC45_PHYPA|nr:hypothetical protein PHYPA_030320 [Physcomitrium patens]